MTNVGAVERTHAVEMLQKMITRESVIHTRTDFGKGETDYVRAYVIVPTTEYALQHIVDVSYYVARAAGLRVNDRGIKFSGGQYNKGLEAADSAWRAVFGESLPQGENWLELR